MKKAVSLILALTLCMALAIPAMAAGYGEVSLPYEGKNIVFEAATVEKKTVKTMVLDYNIRDYVEVSYPNATLITVKPGSTVQCSDFNATVYVAHDDGTYYESQTIFDFVSGKVDNWFEIEVWSTPVLRCVRMIKLTADNGDICFIVPGGDSAPSGDSPAPTPTPAAKPVVVPTSQKLTVNGTAKNTEIYNIDGSNYFKLRDMAALLNGTTSQFSVDYDAARNTIVVKTGEAYTPVGGELATGTDKSASAVQSAQSIEINGAKVELTAFNIGGNNFFKLRELGTALGFDVDYDTATATMIVKSR